MVLAMQRDSLAQFRDTHHRWVLIWARYQSVSCSLPHVYRAVFVRKTLPKIDRIMLDREARHDLEYGGTVTRKNGICLLHAFTPCDGCQISSVSNTKL